MDDTRVIVPRWVQLVMLPLAVGRAGGLRRAHFPRGAAVLVVMLGVVCVLAGLGVLIANPVADQVSAFRSNVPDIIDDANASLDDLQAWLDRNGVGLQIKDEGQTALGTLGERL